MNDAMGEEVGQGRLTVGGDSDWGSRTEPPNEGVAKDYGLANKESSSAY